MKNYYEILEVDKNASQEVIEKAYKALAKKYHPDLQQGAKQKEYAEKMKIINEAYDILADNLKREQYNQQLQNEQRKQEINNAEQERLMQENYNLRQQLNRMGYQQTQKNQQMDEGTIINMTRILQQQIRAAKKQAYHDAYIEDLKSRGYKIRYKHDLKYYLKAILVIAITIFICFLIYQIPVVKNYCAELYKGNMVFQAIVDIFKNTFSAGF